MALQIGSKRMMSLSSSLFQIEPVLLGDSWLLMFPDMFVWCSVRRAIIATKFHVMLTSAAARPPFPRLYIVRGVRVCECEASASIGFRLINAFVFWCLHSVFSCNNLFETCAVDINHVVSCINLETRWLKPEQVEPHS